MSNNTISKIELPNGNVYDIVDAINLGKDDENDIISEKYLKLTGGILTGPLQIKNKLSVLYGSGSNQVLFMVDRGELNLWRGSFGDSITTNRTTDIIPGAINMFGYLCGMNITGTADYPGSEPGLVDVDNSSTQYRNGLIEIKDKNNAIWFKVNYEGMNFQGPVTFSDNLDIAGALNVGDPATTRTNLGITPANIGAVANTDIIPILQGGTGGATPQNAKANLNLGTVTQNFIVSQPIETNQAFGMGCVVDNSNYSARNGHRLSIILKEESIGLYDSAQDTWVWEIPGNAAATVVALGENDTTAASIYPKLDKVAIGTLALIYIQANAITALSSKVTTSSFGIVYRMNPTYFRFFVADVSMSTSGPYIHRFSSIVSASSIEPGSVAYRYSGSIL